MALASDSKYFKVGKKNYGINNKMPSVATL